MGRVAFVAVAAALLAGCDGDRDVRGGGEEAAAWQQAYRLWQDLDEAYPAWPTVAPAPVPAKEPHGAWIRTHYNEVAAAAAPGTGPWPEGSLILVENFAPAPDGPELIEAIDIMLKRDGAWFWARFTPPEPSATGPLRLTRRTDIAIAGGALLRCGSCHRQLARRDHVIARIAP